MKRTLIATALLAAVSATPSFAQSAAEKTGVNSALGIAPKTEDFIKEAAMSDLLEIEAAKVAQQKGDADDKKFAGMMITDHTKTSTELKGLTPADLKGAIPASLDAAHQKKLDKLKDTKPRILRPSTIRCRSALIRMPCRFSSATRMAARMQRSRSGPGRPCPHSSIISTWRRNWTRTARSEPGARNGST